MGSKRVFAISRRRRGFGRAAAILGALALGVLTIALGACGRSGHGAQTDSEKAADVEVLNGILAHELTVVDAYARVLPRLRGEALAVARQFQGQDQAHVDALTKAIRGVGGETDAEAEELETPGPHTAHEALLLAYEEENAALSQALGAAPHLQTAAPRMLAGALAANHAQHVAVLRQLLGAGLAESVPGAFEPGDVPPPASRGEGVAVPPGKGG
jgi:Ferritin-like domain